MGKEHSLAWDNNGILYGWGNGRDGKLGISVENINIKKNEKAKNVISQN